ncbi:MAG: hypothetical protein AB8B49_08300 [Nitratireductor sp.]
MIFTTLKALHLIALMFGSVASLGNLYVMFSKGPHDLDAPAYTKRLAKFYRVTSLFAVLVLWASGLLMLISFGGWVSGTAFMLKLGFVGLLTLIVLFTNFMAPKWQRAGGPPAYVSKLAWVSSISLILIVIFAVTAFN